MTTPNDSIDLRPILTLPKDEALHVRIEGESGSEEIVIDFPDQTIKVFNVQGLLHEMGFAELRLLTTSISSLFLVQQLLQRIENDFSRIEFK